MHPDIRQIYTETPDYQQMIDLRMQVLLDPIGIPRSYIDAEKEKGDVLLAAFDGEEMVACCILTRVSDNTVQLRQMAVNTNCQHTGIGRQLVAFAESWARSQGISKMILHAREAVVAFYGKCGYTIYGDRFEEVGIGHFRMQKPIKKQP